jgi:pyruvate formate lyase activating enzyme
VARLCGWFVETLGPDVPLHLTAFHPDFTMTALPRTPAATLSRARAQALATGLRHVYTGNVHDEQGQSTYCASCGEVLIQRDWYRLGRYHLDATGRCHSCGASVPGRFEAAAGSWGPRRRRLAIV